MIDIVVPDLGLDSTDQITISTWFVDIGDEVVESDRLVELLCNEITFDVMAPASGRLARISADVDDLVSAGTVIGQLSDDGV